MMILKIKNIDYDFILNGGELYNIKIENPKYLFELIKKLKDLDEETLFLYDTNLLDISKRIMFIDNLFELEINSKKQITNLYTKIEKEEINDNYRALLADINERIYNLMNDICLNFNVKLNYDDTLDFKTLFSSINLKYSNQGNSFLELLTIFLKVIKETTKINLLITLNMYDLLDEKDMQILSEELKYQHLSIINIGNDKIGTFKNIIIDNDLCQIT